MSIKLLNELFQNRSVPAKLRNTLVALCDTAGDEGYCHPTIAYLAWKTESSERTVSRSIGELERLGAVHIKKRYKQSSIYKVDLNALPKKEPWQKSVSEEYADFEEEILARQTDGAGSPDNLSPDKRDTKSDKRDKDLDKRDTESTPDGVHNRHGTVNEPSGNHISPPAKAGGDSGTISEPDSEKKKQRKAPPKRAAWGNRSADDLYELVKAWCEGRGHTYQDLAGSARQRATAASKKLPEKYTPKDIYECTQYIMSDPWKAENKSDFIHVVEALATWEASGKPDTSVAGARAARSWRKHAEEDKGLTLEQIRELKAQVAESERGL